MGRIRRLVVGAGILVLIPAIAIYSQTRPNPSLDAGLVELNKGNIFEAIRIFKQIVHAEPSVSAVFFYLAGIYSGMGRYGTAYGYLRTAMKDNTGQGAYFIAVLR